MRKLCYLLLASLLLCGCRTTKTIEVPVIEERIYHDTIKSIQQLLDSVYMHDSVYICQRGDTVFQDRWRTKYVERLVYRDSISIVRDTIPTEVKVTETVTAYRVPWYAKFLSTIGGVCLFLATAAVVAYVIKR